MRLNALVPVISLDYGDGLKGPGNYDVKRRDILQGNVKMIFGSDSRVSMYVEGCKSKPVLSMDSKGSRYYDLGEVLDEIDANPKKNYSISLSIDSKPRFHVARIYTTNNYYVNVQEKTIQMDALAGNKAMVFLMKGREVISSSRLNAGVNSFSDLMNGANTLIIKEYSRKDEDYTTTIVEQTIADELYYEVTNKGFKLYYRDKTLEFFSNPGDLAAIIKEIEMKSRFNEWLRHPNMKQRIIALFK